TVFIVYLAIGSGFVAEAVGGSMSYTQFSNECLRVLTLQKVIPATLRTIVFGYAIGLTGCYYGINATGGAEGVGQAATRSVVLATILVLALNVILVKLIQVS